MALVPHKHSYQRVRRDGSAHAGPSGNPASNLTDHGGEPRPADLGWCTRRRWRVIYYAYRHATRQPLWEGAEDFVSLMAEVLSRLSNRFEPIDPVSSRTPDAGTEGAVDPRRERVSQPSLRVYPTPVLEPYLKF